MKILEPQPKTTELETLGVGRKSALASPPGDSDTFESLSTTALQEFLIRRIWGP